MADDVGGKREEEGKTGAMVDLRYVWVYVENAPTDTIDTIPSIKYLRSMALSPPPHSNPHTPLLLSPS